MGLSGSAGPGRYAEVKNGVASVRFEAADAAAMAVQVQPPGDCFRPARRSVPRPMAGARLLARAVPRR